MRPSISTTFLPASCPRETTFVSTNATFLNLSSETLYEMCSPMRKEPAVAGGATCVCASTAAASIQTARQGFISFEMSENFFIKYSGTIEDQDQSMSDAKAARRSFSAVIGRPTTA